MILLNTDFIWISLIPLMSFLFQDPVHEIVLYLTIFLSDDIYLISVVFPFLTSFVVFW